MRMGNNKEYSYLLQDIEFFKSYNKKMYQTLNADVYKKDNDKIDADKKAREEERKQRNANANPDLILDETLEIMCDFSL